MIKKLISIISVVLVLSTSLVSGHSHQQDAGRKGIRTTIVVSRQNILPYESLSVMVVLRNEAPGEQAVKASWCSFLNIGEITPNGKKWRDYLAYDEPAAQPCVSTEKTLAPGESKMLRAHIDYEASGEHVFARPGDYLLRGGTTDGSFVSDELKISVRTPTGVDAKAYAFLRNSNLHHFFGEYSINKYKYDQKTLDELEKFISDFDGSEYSYLARTGLAFMWLKGVEGKQDQAKAVELLTQVAERAGDPLASAAEYHLGRITYSGGRSMVERQQKIVEANYHFQRVLNGTPSLYFKYLAEQALHQP